ncbi:MAG: hypothetical protein ACUVUG_08200 [Candidatus Aminicenantia bacterium]
MERYSVTEEDMRRYHVLKRVKEGLITLKGASSSCQGNIGFER